MYRIELSPGEETVFRSIEELAVAIKRGVVTPRARIYHNASSKWLPIQFHPHYKTAVSMPLSQSALVAGPPVKPIASLNLEAAVPSDPPLPPALAPRAVAQAPRVAAPAPRVAAPAPRAAAPGPVAAPAEASVPPAPSKKRSAKEKPADKRPRRQGKPHRQLRIALVGALLLGGAQWVLSEPLFSRTDAAALFRTHRRLLVTPANTAAMIPVLHPEEPSSAASFGGIGNTAPPRSIGSTDSAVMESGSNDQVEPAPPSFDVSAPQAPAGESLVSVKSQDSTSQKAMKGILRSVSGPAKAKGSSRR
jgi:hypothetical protein